MIYQPKKLRGGGGTKKKVSSLTANSFFFSRCGAEEARWGRKQRTLIRRGEKTRGARVKNHAKKAPILDDVRKLSRAQ